MPHFRIYRSSLIGSSSSGVVSTVISQITARLLSLSLVRRAWEARGGAFVVRLGIAGRLGVAFGAVAVLATAANLIAEHGTQLIRTTVVVSPIVRPALPAERGISVTSAAAAPSGPIAPVTEVTDNLLIEAINQFERAVERRAEVDSAENVDLLKVAGLRVRDQAEAFLEEINTPGIETRARALRPRVRDLRNAGDEVVRVADDRRAVLAEYWSHFESADAHVKKALDQNNWKIFGRVISRQSLLGLSRELDDIRRGSTQLNTAGENAAMLNSLAQSQARFAAFSPAVLS